jgi:hypothetical protein
MILLLCSLYRIGAPGKGKPEAKGVTAESGTAVLDAGWGRATENRNGKDRPEADWVYTNLDSGPKWKSRLS